MKKEDARERYYGRWITARSFFFFMNHKHREETPILRECQEFSRELSAFATATATAAAHARVRGSVTFLFGCGARSIAPIRARFTTGIYHGARTMTTAATNDNATIFVRRRDANASTRDSATRRDERDARAYRYYADRPAAGTIAERRRFRDSGGV